MRVPTFSNEAYQVCSAVDRWKCAQMCGTAASLAKHRSERWTQVGGSGDGGWGVQEHEACHHLSPLRVSPAGPYPH